MTQAGIKRLLRRPEGRTLEFKRNMSSLPPVLRTLVAFANTAGGTLIVGRDDDGAVPGLKNAKVDEERLANAVAEGISPILLPDIDVVRVGGREVLVVRVARWPGPFFLRKLGEIKGVYVRLGSSNRRADDAMREELERASRRLAFDELPCIGAEITDLDVAAIKKTFSAVGRRIDDAELETLGIVTRYGETLIPSNGGIILFGTTRARRRFFDDARIRCARFAGSDKAEFLDRLDLEGSVLMALDDVPKFIRRNTRMAAKIKSLRRQDIPEYPPVSLREALVNAVVHTDYAQRGSQIMVSVFSNRLVIQNPGMMPFGMTIEDFKAGVSRIRNPVIARVFRELDLMEEWGSGYRRISDDCKDGGYPTPEWQELASVVRVEFPPHPQSPETASQPTGPRAQSATQSPTQSSDPVLRLLSCLVSGERSSGDLRNMLNLSHRATFRKNYLHPALRENLIEYTIPNKPTSRLQKYRLTEKGRGRLEVAAQG